MAARNLCEDFAPRNEAARLCWERGANRAAEMSAEGEIRNGSPAVQIRKNSEAPKNSGRITSTAANESKNSLFCVLFRSLFLHNLCQRLSLKLFKQDFLDSAKLLMESARGIL